MRAANEPVRVSGDYNGAAGRPYPKEPWMVTVWIVEAKR